VPRVPTSERYIGDHEVLPSVPSRVLFCVWRN
jgi:hypothetical protein